MYQLHYQGEKNQPARNDVIVTANVVPSSLILTTLTMEAICSFETLVLTRATWRNIPEDSALHSHCRENLKSYIPPTVLYY
jgi:hypothetical protein